MFGAGEASSSLFPTPPTTAGPASTWSDLARAPLAARRGEEGAFASFLPGSAAPEDPEQAARRAAEEFVSIALVQPILASLRENNNAAPPFAPGDAERRFSPMLDAEIARRIVQREDYALVNEVARRLKSADFRAPGADGPAAAMGREVDRHA